MSITEWTVPEGLDPEVLALCKAINECVDGVITVESCCGHGNEPYRIWLHAETLGDLPPLLYWLDRCHTGLDGWQMIAYTDCAADHVTLMLQGPVGAYGESEQIARHIRAHS